MIRGNTDNSLNCPFCEKPIDEPQEIKTSFGSTFTGGKCGCGAVYVFDRGGHNLGDAYVDALAYACNNDWDKAWSLVPDEDYDLTGAEAEQTGMDNPGFKNLGEVRISLFRRMPTLF